MADKKDKLRKLRVYERDRIYPQSLSYYFKVFYASPRHYHYLAKGWELGVFIDDYFWWAREVDFLEQSFQHWLDSWLTDEKAKKEIFFLYREQTKKAKRYFTPLAFFDFTKMSNEKLAEKYDTAVSLASEHLLFSEYTTDLFDDFFGKIFIEELERLSGREISQEDIIDFSRPATLSASAKYRAEILRMALKYDFDSLNSTLQKYNWIQMSWDGSNEITMEEIESEIEQTKAERKKEEIKKELVEIDSFSSRVKARREELLAKYGLSRESVEKYFSLLDEFNVFHDYRKEVQMRANQVIYRILREITSRFSVHYSDLMFYLPEEILQIFSGNRLADAEIIAKRRSGMALLIEGGEVKEFFGAEARKILQEEIISVMKAERVKEIKGTPASQGEYTGIAFVTKSAKEANQSLEKGQILITSMTTVDYLPAMKRSGAIITDDGGATCHAAVMSRELGIPCIVGTKTATQIFKSGDKIFVDAKKGIVKKL